MAKTYGELILECENFEYSKENYELTKECYELSLMAQFIESQQFISDNIIDIRNEYNEFDESYFGESVDENTTITLLESADKKSKNIFKRIWRGLKSIWKKIKGFFARLFGKSKKTTKDNSELLALVEECLNDILEANLQSSGDDGDVKSTSKSSVEDKEVKETSNETNKEEPKTEPSKESDVNKEDKKEKENKTDNTTPSSTKESKVNVNINDILENSWKQEYKNDGYIISNNQPFARNIKNRSLRRKKNKHTLNMLAAALSDTEVVISITQDKKILSIDDLISVFENISTLTDESSQSDVDKIKKCIKDGIIKVKKSGVVIKVDPDSLDSTIAKLNEITSKMESLLKESVDDEDIDLSMFTEASVAQKKRQKRLNNQINGGPKSKNNSSGGKGMSFDDFKNGGYKEIMTSVTGLKDVYTDVMTISGNMMKLYNYVESYRHNVGTKLGSALDKYRPSK